MGTRSLISEPRSKSTSDHRMGFGHLEVKKEFRIKKETPDDEIKVRFKKKKKKYTQRFNNFQAVFSRIERNY